MSQIKQVVQNIFDILKTKQNESSFHYVRNNEFDSNVTDFEGLSNDSKIVLKSNLSERNDKIAIRLLQMVLDDNYLLIEDIDELQAHLDETFSNELITSLTNNNADVWYNIMSKLATYADIIHTSSVPIVSHNYTNPKYQHFQQRILLVDDLNVNLYLDKMNISVK